MREFFADMHIHSPYAGGVSKLMTIKALAEQAELKGLNIMATGDILHKKWLEHCKENLAEEKNGIFGVEGFETKFILSTEVEGGGNRTHHLLYFPDFAAVETFKENTKKYCRDFDGVMSGRPKINVKGEKIAEEVEKIGGLIGPAHAFTPYTGFYPFHNSLKDCYGEFTETVKFIELGLSADSNLADTIKELETMAFLSNSDAHSPWPHRIGREFNRLKINESSFKEFKFAVERRDGRAVTLNCGLDPREGKYHVSACRSCHTPFKLEKARELKWRCVNCGDRIKKGVKDRILELNDKGKTIHPDFRPDYLHIIPLAEIIQISLGANSPASKNVQGIWSKLVNVFKTEINVLINEPVVNISEIDERTAKYIEAFRNRLVAYIPGGGGNYGKPIICFSREELDEKELEIESALKSSGGQKTLFQF